MGFTGQLWGTCTRIACTYVCSIHSYMSCKLNLWDFVGLLCMVVLGPVVRNDRAVQGIHKLYGRKSLWLTA